MKLRSIPVRVGAVLAVTAALTLAPSAAFADNFEGDGGDNNITGTSGDDTIAGNEGDDDVNGDPGFTFVGGDDQISGGSGEDQIQGDGTTTIVGGDDRIDGGEDDDEILGDGFTTGVGGDDAIEGGDGDDVISGDGTLTGVGGDDTINGGGGNDFIAGDGAIIGLGGNDFINGGEGNDTIYGDGILDALIGGGDDELYGDDGADDLFGGGGNDLLCGGAGDDLLLGQDGIDLGCAVDDETTVASGDESEFNVSLNDDQLDDEGTGSDAFLDESATPLLYRIVGGSIDAIIDAVTGIVTFTAMESGTIDYEVYREFMGNDIIVSLATLFVTVTPPPAADDPDEPSDVAPAETALLPDTGAGDTRTQGGIAVALILGGVGLLFGSRRKPQDRQPVADGPEALTPCAAKSVLEVSADQVSVMTAHHVAVVRESGRRGGRVIAPVATSRASHRAREVQLV